MEEIFIIRKAKPEDLDSLLKVLHQLSPLKRENNNEDINRIKQTLNEIINNKNYYLSVFEYNAKVVGTGLLLIQMNLFHNGKPSGHIENISIDNEYRKRGFGKLIVNNLIEEAKKQGCYKVILNCKKELINFYSKLNLRETGVIEMRLDLDN